MAAPRSCPPIVLAVALRMALGLGWRPEEIYTVQLS